jgi:hypothetical protein
MRKHFDWLPDFIWPHLTGEAERPPSEDEFLRDNIDPATLRAAEIELKDRDAGVHERARNVETKLISLLALTSILAVGTSGSLTVASAANLDNLPYFPLVVGLPIVFYISIQLILSLWATVEGLMRRNYKGLSENEIDPRPGESENDYRMRLYTLRREHTWWNEGTVNTKVSEMAVAHAALKNALAATAVLVVVSVVIALIRLGLAR